MLTFCTYLLTAVAAFAAGWRLHGWWMRKRKLLRLTDGADAVCRLLADPMEDWVCEYVNAERNMFRPAIPSNILIHKSRKLRVSYPSKFFVAPIEPFVGLALTPRDTEALDEACVVAMNNIMMRKAGLYAHPRELQERLE